MTLLSRLSAWVRSNLDRISSVLEIEELAGIGAVIRREYDAEEAARVHRCPLPTMSNAVVCMNGECQLISPESGTCPVCGDAVFSLAAYLKKNPMKRAKCAEGSWAEMMARKTKGRGFRRVK